MLKMRYADWANSQCIELTGPSPFECLDGGGTITCYPLFDGVKAVLLQLETRCFIETRTKKNALEINFCSNGRFESSFSARDHVILKPGDMSVSTFDGIHGTESQSTFPAVAPLVGDENAEATIELLLSMCMAEPYGEEAIALYAEDPASMRFNCYFIGGVDLFTIDGNTITGTDSEGNEVFSHSYTRMNVENENDFIFYQSDDPDAGQFTYFAFSPDTMETTYHLEFRYSENIDDLQSWFEGAYAYWNVGAFAADYTDEVMYDVINLFATENLAGEE